MTRLSVIIAAHNEEGYLGQCLESLRGAAIPDWEIIVVDDASEDRTPDVARHFRDQGLPITLLSHAGRRNRGVGASRNLGIAHARGAYLGFLDADDLVVGRRFDRALALLDARPEIDGVQEAVGIVFENAQAEASWGAHARLFTHDTQTPPDGFLEATFARRVQPLTPGLVLRASLMGRCGGYDTSLRRSEDFHLWLRMAACGRFVVGEASRPVCLYRRHDANTWMPHERDSFRDLGVVSEVLGWARHSPWVGDKAVQVLRRELESKLFHCFGLARRDGARLEGARAACAAARREPSLLRSRRFWANCLLLAGGRGQAQGSRPR